MPKDTSDRRDRFIAEFDAQLQRSDGRRIVNSLCYGLTELRGLLFTRVHADVERNFGRDSMVMPMSLLASEDRARLEIDIFQIATSSAQVQQHKYVADPAWYLDWLRRLRLDDSAYQDNVRKRLERYWEMTEEERRVGFSRVLEKTFPEATRAPLVLYRLFPLSVAIATALAFSDDADARRLRQQQISWLPAIADCQECRGQVLENGERCATCSNPLWTYDWLNVAS